ncbi:hypothetical protein ACCO45_004498 [Purpureocillium lilacinum]|uniref:Uncharacterized protein n=1 Tax=Purpureocillium lilacinum TaxID=33203 RepID=A0ACC4E5M4_PURLI
MPPAELVPHAVLTLEDSYMVGGMFMDAPRILDSIRKLSWIVTHPTVTNEPVPLQLLSGWSCGNNSAVNAKDHAGRGAPAVDAHTHQRKVKDAPAGATQIWSICHAPILDLELICGHQMGDKRYQPPCAIPWLTPRTLVAAIGRPLRGAPDVISPIATTKLSPDEGQQILVNRRLRHPISPTWASHSSGIVTEQIEMKDAERCRKWSWVKKRP